MASHLKPAVTNQHPTKGAPLQNGHQLPTKGAPSVPYAPPRRLPSMAKHYLVRYPCPQNLQTLFLPFSQHPISLIPLRLRLLCLVISKHAFSGTTHTPHHNRTGLTTPSLFLFLFFLFNPIICAFHYFMLKFSP